MKNKNVLWVFVLLFPVATAFIKAGQRDDGKPLKRWVISQNSNLSVNGSTNINTFSCVIPAYDKTDTITIKEKNDKGVTLSGNIDLSVSSFDCHNSGMTKQLRKTLNEKQFPVLHIRFLSLSNLPVMTRNPEPVTGLVDIEIAGVVKRFEINYQISRDEENIVHLLGSRDLNFSDFKITPPRKLGGMIKTKNQLTVAFHLKMKTI
jgi:YceI-like domain